MAKDSATKKQDVDKRRRILQAALELFTLRGFHGTAMPLVARQAAVGTGTIYRYFDSKETLVNELFQQSKRTMIAFLLADDALKGDARKQFKTIFSRLMDFSNKEPRIVEFLELHHHASYLDTQSRSVELELLRPFYEFCVKASKQGELKQLAPETLMSIVWGAFVGLVKSRQLGFIQFSDRLIEEAERCCWDAIRA